MPRYRSARQEKDARHDKKKDARQDKVWGMSPRAPFFVAPSALYVAPSRKARGPSLRSGRQKEWDDKKNGTTKRMGRQKERDDKKKGGTTKRMGRQKERDDKKNGVPRGDKEKSRWITLEA